MLVGAQSGCSAHQRINPRRDRSNAQACRAQAPSKGVLIRELRDMVIPLTPVAFAPMGSFLISLGFGGSAFSSVAKKCPCRSQRDKHIRDKVIAKIPFIGIFMCNKK